MRFWRRIVRNYFTFNNREKRGLYVLLIFLFLLSIIHLTIRLTPPREIELSDDHKAMVHALNEVNQNQSKKMDTASRALKNDLIEENLPVWRMFDPNVVDSNTLFLSGLDSNIARRLIKYRLKGGKFKSREDVARIYGMKQEWLSEAGKYMYFPGISDKVKPSNNPDSSFMDSNFVNRKRIVQFELNTVDSTTLEALPWVGPFYAGEIVKLRNRLGGFRSYDQLLYVYRMNDEAIQVIIENSTLDTMLVEKIDLNQASIEQLGYHPYLTWKQARIILNYRAKHGPFQSKKEILKTRVISDSVYIKIAPYLTTSNDN